ncbi:MAG: ATP-dependent sacrificial sulfur transferase LarE [Clostridia bacterium]|nr:ATP-dependent sacrificial sulfur transferase LarE [Clostridia bacterium]
MDKKLEILREYIHSLGSVAVAFSGGVDSTLLLKVAQMAIGNSAVAVTVSSCLVPECEVAETEEFCATEGIRQIIVRYDPLAVPGFAENLPERCYLCKSRIFDEIKKSVAPLAINNIAEGSNVDDEGDYRPGMRAVAEQGILSPLRYAGLNKAEIRALSARLGLATANKPSLACLASRIAYGDVITEEKLRMTDAAETYLHRLGFGQLRVRLHGSIARIELMPEEISKMFEVRNEVYIKLKSLGFKYVSLDLGGYKTGSMN